MKTLKIFGDEYPDPEGLNTLTLKTLTMTTPTTLMTRSAVNRP